MLPVQAGPPPQGSAGFQPAVSQTSSLLRLLDQKASPNSRRRQAGSPAIRQVGNLRYPLVSWLILLFAVGACAGADLNVSVSTGFGGIVKPGRWTFLRVSCVNPGESFEGRLETQGFTSNDRPLSERYEAPVVLPRGSKKDYFVYLPFDPQAAYWRVGLRAGRSERVIFEEEIGRKAGGSGSPGFTALVADQAMLVLVADESQPSVEIRLDALRQVWKTTPVELPDRWLGFDAVNAVVARSDVFQRAPDPRLDALLDWVGAGGHLVVVAEAMDAGRFHPAWAERFGVQRAPTVSLAADESFVARYGAPPERALRAGFEGEFDEVLIGDADGPVLFRNRHGLGTITFVAVDLLNRSWRDWPGAARCWRDALGPSLTMSGSSVAQRYANYGYEYHAQNLINGLRQIPALRPPSFAMLGAYLCLYLFVMVGVNYAVLRRFDRKEWSLFTFPAIAIVFGIGAYWSGYLLRGGSSVVQQVSVVELAAGQPQGRARTYIGYFSATRGPRSLTFPLDMFPQYFLYNPYNPRAQQQGLPTLRVIESARPQATVPISVWTMRTFVADGPVRFEEGIGGRVTIREAGGALELEGRIENHLPVTIERPVYLLGSSSRIDETLLAPGAARSLTSFRLNPSTYHGHLPDAALNAVSQWWHSERREAGSLYLMGKAKEERLENLALEAGRDASRQSVLVVARIPVRASAEQRTFGPNWWEATIAAVDSSSLHPINWPQRDAFNINRGKVTFRFSLLGHEPGRRLTRIVLVPSTPLGQASVAVRSQRDGTWKDAPNGKPTEFDAADVFDEVTGVVEIRLDAGQGSVQFMPGHIQITGDAE